MVSSMNLVLFVTIVIVGMLASSTHSLPAAWKKNQLERIKCTNECWANYDLCEQRIGSVEEGFICVSHKMMCTTRCRTVRI